VYLSDLAKEVWPISTVPFRSGEREWVAALRALEVESWARGDMGVEYK
jgi:hypothetical protein